jgi:Na+/H+ antiporter NhaD/arsenite permease-like protein
MKRILTIVFSLFLLSGIAFQASASHHEDVDGTEHVEHHDAESNHESHDDKAGHEAHAFNPIADFEKLDTEHKAKVESYCSENYQKAFVACEQKEQAIALDSLHVPPMWLIFPFVGLLLMIATGPLFFEHFWHKNYPIVAFALAFFVAAYYGLLLHDGDSVIHAAAEYVQFIALLAGLFMASGGILIKVDKEGTAMTNVMLLLIGAILANFIGTTGASMLLIRPFIRLNKDRIKPYHIIFFIFMVSNVGGSLTPVGDPPLFLGFLKGVPFTWTITHNIVPWAFASLCLAGLFFVFDSKNKSGEGSTVEYSGKTTIQGGKNFVWIALVIGAVFIDPNKLDWVPSIEMTLHGHLTKISYVREVIMLSVAGLSYYFADEEALKGNEFEFEPIKEVAFIFVGIFFTMIPALQIVAAFAKANPEMISLNMLYWGTGALSGVLDNAPTYVNFLTAAVSSAGGSVADPAQVANYAYGVDMFEVTASTTTETSSIVRLTAISVASVFFGAMTYIGNAPNFMVKSIAEQVGVQMPAFFSYVLKFSIPILLPILFLVWLIFFQLEAITLFF